MLIGKKMINTLMLSLALLLAAGSVRAQETAEAPNGAMPSGASTLSSATSAARAEEGEEMSGSTPRPDPATSLTLPAASAGAFDTFEKRRQAMMQAVLDEYQNNGNKPTWHNVFWKAGAMFEMGKIEAAHRLCNYALDGLQPGNKINKWLTGGNSGFAAWPGIDTYIRFEHLMNSQLKARFKDTYTSAVFYRRFTTSNHVVMAGVTRYLAVQTWGRDAFKPHPAYAGKVYEEMTPEQRKTVHYPASQLYANEDPDAIKFVSQFVERVVKNGPGEYASRPYGAENTLPLLTLADCAKDPEIRAKAIMAYEATVVQLAPPYLRGHLATFAPRSYPDMENQSPWGIAVIPWLYFGGVPPGGMQNQWALRCATSKFRLPDCAIAAGTDRSKPYEHRAYFSGWNLDHYVTPKYVVYARSPKTTVLVNKGRYPFQGQSYPCGVMWEADPSLCSHLWVTCPAADDNTSKSNCPNGLHTHGVTQNEQEVMHKNALLWVFRIAPDFRNPYGLGFVPGGALAAINDSESAGRIYLHFGNILISLASTTPFKWDPKSGIKAPAGKVPPGSSEFRIPPPYFAVAMEVAPPEEFPGKTPAEQLAKFKATLLAKTKLEVKVVPPSAATIAEVNSSKKPDKSKLEPKPVGYYTDREGSTLECAFDGEDKINGKTVDYKNWPTIENPWMSQTGPEKLTLTDGKSTRVYDYVNWKMIDSKNAANGK